VNFHGPVTKSGHRINVIPLTQLIHENRPIGKGETRRKQRRSGKFVDLALNELSTPNLQVDDWDWYFKMRRGIHP
jgi:hypothetical protein